jgi:hypothetical protein
LKEDSERTAAPVTITTQAKKQRESEQKNSSI